MRNGDFAVEVVPRGRGVGVRELDSGHVLARPGQVYALRLRNHGPLRCVADVCIDGRTVTAGGLVIEAGCTEELERPITPDEDGCFTVVAEGDERAFGPDGGRDNEDLGLIEVRFRRELPGGDRPRPLPESRAGLLARELNRPPAKGPTRLTPDVAIRMGLPSDGGAGAPNGHRFGGRLDQFSSALFAETAPAPYVEPPQLDDIERAAGTGLTGHSTQRFRPTQLGPLETEATVLTLRLVIATEESIRTAPARRDEKAAPVRPLARP
jgi:hypothetical protein